MVLLKPNKGDSLCYPALKLISYQNGLKRDSFNRFSLSTAHQQRGTKVAG